MNRAKIELGNGVDEATVYALCSHNEVSHNPAGRSSIVIASTNGEPLDPGLIRQLGTVVPD